MLTSDANLFSIAAGCFGSDGFGDHFPVALNLDRFTAITLKTTTLAPRDGNTGKTVHDSPDFTLNAIGLRNPGIQAVLKETFPQWHNRGCPTGLSVWGTSADEYRRLAELAAHAGVDYIELNLSCVNAETPTLTSSEIAEIAAACAAPVYAKVGLSSTSEPVHPDDLHHAAEIAGITSLAGIIMGNTVSVPTNGLLSTPFGGLSGARLRKYNLAWVQATARRAEIPIIAAGGISTAEHIRQYRDAGATGFQIGTAMRHSPVITWQTITEGHANHSVYLVLDYITNLREQTASAKSIAAYESLLDQCRRSTAEGKLPNYPEMAAQAELIARQSATTE